MGQLKQTGGTPKKRPRFSLDDDTLATMANRPVNSDVLQVLGDNSTTKGNKFLPSTLTNDIIAEPLVKNQLRERETVTQITNLVIPRISFTIDDDDFIQDGEAAKEIELKGDSVNFGRFQTKVKAGITDTVLMGTNTNLVQTVENNLRAGLAAKERKVSFATSPKSGEEHMSFYDKTEVNIEEVEGNDLYEAITKHLTFYHASEYGKKIEEPIRYKYNTDEVLFDIDTYSLKTQIKGYGKLKEGVNTENPKDSDYVFTPITYTSPESKRWGVRIQDPINDERYTVSGNMLDRLKNELQDYPSVSGSVTLKWYINPRKGDYVPFIYEPLNINTYIQVVGIKTYPAIPNKPPEVTLSNTRKTMTAILANMVKKGVI